MLFHTLVENSVDWFVLILKFFVSSVQKADKILTRSWHLWCILFICLLMFFGFFL